MSHPEAREEQSVENDAVESSEDLLIGRVLGSYRLLSRIGSGAYGEVYRAEHVRLGVEYAVKILHPAFALQPNALKRFWREAQTTGRLKHENIVSVTDFDVDKKLGPYLIMELLEGETLADLLEAQERLTLPQVRSIARPICKALSAAHNLGVIHRDLKPENIFLAKVQEKKVVKVLDFGIARLTEGGESLTGIGQTLGTPEYMSPEQCRGLPLTPQSDIYCFGVLLYQMLTGTLPFVGSDPHQFMFHHLLTPPPELGAEFSEPLRQFMLQILQKNPEHRPHNMEGVWENLSLTLPSSEDPAYHSVDGVTLEFMPFRLPSEKPAVQETKERTSSELKVPIEEHDNSIEDSEVLDEDDAAKVDADTAEGALTADEIRPDVATNPAIPVSESREKTAEEKAAQPDFGALTPLLLNEHEDPAKKDEEGEVFLLVKKKSPSPTMEMEASPDFHMESSTQADLMAVMETMEEETGLSELLARSTIPAEAGTTQELSVLHAPVAVRRGNARSHPFEYMGVEASFDAALPREMDAPHDAEAHESWYYPTVSYHRLLVIEVDDQTRFEQEFLEGLRRGELFVPMQQPLQVGDAFWFRFVLPQAGKLAEGQGEVMYAIFPGVGEPVGMHFQVLEWELFIGTP